MYIVWFVTFDCQWSHHCQVYSSKMFLLQSWVILKRLRGEPTKPAEKTFQHGVKCGLRSWTLHREWAWRWPLCSPPGQGHICRATCEVRVNNIWKIWSRKELKSVNKISKQRVNVAYLSGLSRGVRRIFKTRSLYLGLNTFPVENLRDIFFTDWRSLSNWANSFVSVNRWNFAAELMWTTDTHDLGSAVTDWQYRDDIEDLLLNFGHCYFPISVEFHSHVSPSHILVPYHNFHLVVCCLERKS